MMMRMVMIRRVMTMISLREDDNGVILKMMVVMLKTALWCCLMISKLAAAVMMEMLMKIKIVMVNFPGGGSYSQGP